MPETAGIDRRSAAGSDPGTRSAASSDLAPTRQPEHLEASAEESPMSAGITAAEALDTPSGAQIRTSRAEDMQRFLEWHGLRPAKIRGALVTYRRENRYGVEALPEPTAPIIVRWS